MRVSILIIFAALAAFAEEPKPGPTVPAEVRAQIWRSVVDLRNAKEAAQKAQERFEAAQAAWAKACGESAERKIDEQGEPACGAKATPQTPPKTPESAQ